MKTLAGLAHTIIFSVIFMSITAVPVFVSSQETPGAQISVTPVADPSQPAPQALITTTTVPAAQPAPQSPAPPPDPYFGPLPRPPQPAPAPPPHQQSGSRGSPDSRSAIDPNIPGTYGQPAPPMHSLLPGQYSQPQPYQQPQPYSQPQVPVNQAQPPTFSGFPNTVPMPQGDGDPALYGPGNDGTRFAPPGQSYPNIVTPPSGSEFSGQNRNAGGGSRYRKVIVETGPSRTYATVKTTSGTFVIKLYDTKAPKTVRNFIGLARGEKEFVDVRTGRKVTRPFYDGLTVHRVIPDFLVQIGCPFGTGAGGPGYTFPDEFDPGLRHYKAGIVSMGNTGKDTNGSQFFITLGPQPTLDDKFTVFGEVVSGMNVVRRISKTRRNIFDRPVNSIFIESISIEER